MIVYITWCISSCGRKEKIEEEASIWFVLCVEEFMKLGIHELPVCCFA